jgi:hypothetical protein
MIIIGTKMILRNSNPKIVEIITQDGLYVWFRCKKCGKDWSPVLKGSGKLPRGSWQCPLGCKDLKKPLKIQ